jgi:hypothetical protein
LIEDWERSASKHRNTSNWVLSHYYERFDENYEFNREVRRTVNTMPTIQFSNLSSFSQAEDLQGSVHSGTLLVVAQQASNRHSLNTFQQNPEIIDIGERDRIINSMFDNAVATYKEGECVEELIKDIFSSRTKLCSTLRVFKVVSINVEKSISTILLFPSKEKNPFDFSVIVDLSFLNNSLSKNLLDPKLIVEALLRTEIGNEKLEKDMVEEKLEKLIQTCSEKLNHLPKLEKDLVDEILNSFMDCDEFFSFHPPTHSISLIPKGPGEQRQQDETIALEILHNLKSLDFVSYKGKKALLCEPAFPKFFLQGKIQNMKAFFLKDEYLALVFPDTILRVELVPVEKEEMDSIELFPEDDQEPRGNPILEDSEETPVLFTPSKVSTLSRLQKKYK